MVHQGSSGVQIGHVLGAVYDAFTIRLLELAEKSLGAPPVGYAWMALGSHARRELAINSDQDNALILDNAYDPALHADYFQQLSDYVCSGLAQIGLARCPGEVNASNEKWRMRAEDWLSAFQKWLKEPTDMAVMLTSNFYDMRYISGDKPLFRAISHVVYQQASEHPRYMMRLAQQA